MNLESFRKSRGWTQEQLGEAVGIRSKGYVSRIERGLEQCSLRVALRIEHLSGGQVTAASLRPSDAALLARPPATPVAGAH